MDYSQKIKDAFRFRLNMAMRERGIKQKELAASLSVSENMISYYCNGDRVPNLVRLKEIAQCLNVSTDYLLGLTDNMTTNKEIDFIANYTGMTEAAIQNLHDCAKDGVTYAQRFINIIANSQSPSAITLYRHLVLYLTAAANTNEEHNLFNYDPAINLSNPEMLEANLSRLQPIEAIVSRHLDSENNIKSTAIDTITPDYLQAFYLLAAHEDLSKLKQEYIKRTREADNDNQ